MDNIFSDFLDPKIVEGEEENGKKDQGQINLFGFDEEKPIKNIKNNKDSNNESSKNKENIDPEFEKLRSRSSSSVLNKHIQLEELNRLKIENERLIFLKNAGKVAELTFMDFLYFGYMEKANLDLMKMVKKIKVRYETLVPAEELTEVIKILSDEISYVLGSIKKKQKEELSQWKEGFQ